MQTIAIFGYGNVGKKLATLFIEAGKNVIIYSTNGQSGEADHKCATYTAGFDNIDAVTLAIPYTAIEDLITPFADQLAGKTIIDCSNPLNDDWSPLSLGVDTSAAEKIASLLPQSNVVKAFNTIFADVMDKAHHDRDGQRITAFVSGDDMDAKTDTLALAEAAGLAPLDVGPLKSARYLEAMAHLNIQIAVGQGGGTQAAFIYHQG